MKLQQITKEQAAQMFNDGYVIYIQAEDVNQNPETGNTFSLSGKCWDASLNIYKYYLTPEEYGFDNIIAWINERVSNPIKYFTFHSKHHLSIDYWIDAKKLKYAFI